MRKLVVGIGEALWDILPDGKKIGGAPANFAYHVGQFGLDSIAISAIGNDALGNELVEMFNEKNIKYILDKVEYPTGTVLVELDENGIPQYNIKENVAWDNIDFSPELKQIAAEACAVCFGSLAQRNVVSRNTIRQLVNEILTDNALVVFDINLRQNFFTKEIIHESISLCNVLKINDEELVEVSRLFGYPGIDLEEKCKELLRIYNLNILILTCGINGSYVFTPTETHFQPTPRVEVADTVGAGDSFTASFVASLLKGKSIAEAHKKAVEVSAYVCSCNGAMPVLPSELTSI